MKLPKYVKIVEVGPRDGLQNEKKIVPTDIKIDFINQLSQTGLHYIETTSFVSPKWVPQLADALQVMQKIIRFPGVCYSVLIPNIQGLKNALATKIDEIAIFTAASETFSQKNTNSSIQESLERFIPVIALAKEKKIPVRGYVSCAFSCPYEGPISPVKVTAITEKLLQMGCHEISLGDTIGAATPKTTKKLLDIVLEKIPIQQIAMHFHNTNNQALKNIFMALQCGIAIFDSSISGLGGCPYAPGAAGNVATEEVITMLQALEIKTDVNLKKLKKVSEFIKKYL